MFLGRTILLTLILGLAVHGQAHAQKKSLDDIVEALCRNQKTLINNADELADFRFRSQRTFDELLPSPGGPQTIPDADIMRRLGVLTDDSSVKSAVGNLDHPWQRRLAVELGETASDIVRRNGDDGVLILRNMDKEGLTFCRIYPARGRLLDEVYRDSAQATTLLQKTGKVGLDFYEKYVRPHKGKWVAAGLLAAFYSNPEYFIDSAGDLTEYAIKKFGELGIARRVKEVDQPFCSFECGI